MKIQRKKSSAAIPLCSTADIAFLLLIFFIVLAKGAHESTVEWKPARVAIPLTALGDSIVTVAIDKNYGIYVDGQPVAGGALKDIVNKRLGELTRGSRKVLLKVDKDAPARVFQSVLLDLADTGADIFRVLEPGDEKKT